MSQTSCYDNSCRTYISDKQATGQFLTNYKAYQPCGKGKTQTVTATLKQVLSNKTLEGWEIVEEPEIIPDSNSELKKEEILETIKELLDEELPNLLESDKDTIEITQLLEKDNEDSLVQEPLAPYRNIDKIEVQGK